MLPTSFLPLGTTKPWFLCFAGIGSGHTADMVRSDLLGCVQNPATVEAVLALQAAWDAIGAANQTTVLQTAYIIDNPNPLGSKDELNRAPGALQYHAVHERYHDMFRTLVRSKGYYDLFLFNLRGDCVYTVFKEVDFASNLVSGRWRSSGLGDAFRAAVAVPGALHTIDFAPYEPSQGDLASFVSTGVMTDDGVVIGVIALQVPFGVTVKLDSTGARIESCADARRSSCFAA